MCVCVHIYIHICIINELKGDVDVYLPISVTAHQRECLLTADGPDYRGFAQSTMSGRTCQQWSSQTVAYLSSLMNNSYHVFVETVVKTIEWLYCVCSLFRSIAYNSFHIQFVH